MIEKLKEQKKTDDIKKRIASQFFSKGYGIKCKKCKKFTNKCQCPPEKDAKPTTARSKDKSAA